MERKASIKLDSGALKIVSSFSHGICAGSSRGSVSEVYSPPERLNLDENNMSESASQTNMKAPAVQSFLVRVLRQDGPGRRPYWERHRVAYEPNMNCISVLQKIAEQAATVEGKPVAPVAWECNCLEEVCGSCTMLINGRVRQACTALVDHLLAAHPARN